MDWVFMAHQLHTSLTSPWAMTRLLEWCKERRNWTLKQCKHVLWSAESLSGSLMDESGLGGCQENVTFQNA